MCLQVIFVGEITDDTERNEITLSQELDPAY